MKKLLFAGFLTALLAGVSIAEEARFQVFQGSTPGEAGKSAQVPVVIKVDASTGDTWRLLVVNGGYWWVPIKTGVIKSQAAASEEKPKDAAAPPAPAPGAPQ